MELVYDKKKTIKEIEELIKKEQYMNEDINISNKNGAFILGDNFNIMSRLLRNYENKIDLIYIDPPFNTSSCFFYKKDRVSTVSFEKDSTIAYDDNLEIEQYLEFMRERLYLIWRLLSNQGTLYLHIDLKIGHYLKIILDEIFGKENYINDITRIKSNPKNFSRKAFGNEKDVIYIYSKKEKKNIFNNVKEALNDEEIKRLFPKIDSSGRRYTTVPCHAPGETVNGTTGQPWRGILPPKGRHWRCSPCDLEKMDKDGLIEWSSNGVPRIKKYALEHKGKKIQDIWNFKDPQYPIYPTEKNYKMLEMIIKQSSNEESIIMDCFCGSSSFIKAGINNNRCVIGIDKSDIACDVSKSREELGNIDFILG